MCGNGRGQCQGAWMTRLSLPVTDGVKDTKASKLTEVGLKVKLAPQTRRSRTDEDQNGSFLKNFAKWRFPSRCCAGEDGFTRSERDTRHGCPLPRLALQTPPGSRGMTYYVMLAWAPTERSRTRCTPNIRNWQTPVRCKAKANF